MSTTDKSLTGSLPPLTGADTADPTEAVRRLLDDARSDPFVIDGLRGLDDYVAIKRERLSGLRKALRLTQVQIAAELGVNQPEISKLENRETFMVDTLARFVAATGGRLRLIAEYDDGTVVEVLAAGSKDERVAEKS